MKKFKEKKVIMSKEEISRTVKRLAHEIVEKNFGVKNLATNSCEPKPRKPIITLANRRWKKPFSLIFAKIFKIGFNLTSEE